MELSANSSIGGKDSVVTAVLVAVMALAAAKVIWTKASRKRGNLPPGPKGLPVIGNFVDLLAGGQRHLPHRALADLSKKYGPLVFLRLGIHSTVVVSSSQLAQACLSGKNDKIFAGRPSNEALRRMTFGPNSGIGMTSYGDAWRHVRKLCSLHLFTAKRIAEFEPMRQNLIMDLTHRIQEQREEPLNLTMLIQSLTEAMTSGLLIGKSLDQISCPDVEVHKLLDRLTQLYQTPVLGDFIPALGFLDFKIKSEFAKVRTAFQKLFSAIILDRNARSPDSPQTMWDVLVESLDGEWVKSIMQELFAGGIDTSSTILCWAMIELLANPEVMTKMQDELDMKVAQSGEPARRLIRESELGSLVYTKAVLKETFRLHPPLPLLVPHMAMEDCSVGGYKIPKGCRLLVNAWAIGRDPVSWPDQTERFMPERFLTADGMQMDFRGQNPELTPFGMGRRICPGTPLAIPLVESVLANLVYSFKWRLPAGQSIDMTERFSIVVKPANPLLVIASPRHPTL